MPKPEAAPTGREPDVDLPARKLCVVPVGALGDAGVRAALDLEEYAGKLAAGARQLPPLHHGLALRLLSAWRIYCFERNPKRWPDGRYYILERSYQHWRGHRLSFIREELAALGLDEWDRLVIRVADIDGIVPLASDCFNNHPRRRLARYAAVVGSLADAARDRVGVRNGYKPEVLA